MGNNDFAGPGYSVGSVGKCLGPTMSQGLQKMAAKYLNIRYSQSIISLFLYIVSTKLSIFALKLLT